MKFPGSLILRYYLVQKRLFQYHLLGVLSKEVYNKQTQNKNKNYLK